MIALLAILAQIALSPLGGGRDVSTLWEVDFTSQGNVSSTADSYITVAGVAMRFSSSATRVISDIQQGTGMRVQATAPGAGAYQWVVDVFTASTTPTLAYDRPFTIWAYLTNPSSTTCNPDEDATIGLVSDSGAFPTTNAWAYFLASGNYCTSTGHKFGGYSNGTTTGSSVTKDVVDTNPGLTSDVFVVQWDGYRGSYYSGNWNNGWPTFNSLQFKGREWINTGGAGTMVEMGLYTRIRFQVTVNNSGVGKNLYVLKQLRVVQ